jgi:trimeric autotransporter adhesin
MTKIAVFIVMIFACLSSQAQVNIITTIAGNGMTGYEGDNGQATSAKFNRPYSICMDKEENLLCIDAFNHCVRKIELSKGIVSRFAGTGTAGFDGDGSSATDAKLYIPQGINVDTSGNIYISDGGNHRIRKVDKSTGNILTIAGNGNPGMGGDNGPATSAQLNGPAGICVYNNYLYIADYMNKRVRRVNLETNIITTVAGNGTNGYSGDGEAATTAQLNGAIDVTCDADGNVFVADTWNGVVRKVDVSTGIISTVAGTGTSGYSGDDGQATNAQLKELVGLFVDNDHNLFIADYRNGAIRKVNGNTGIITTVAGGVAGFGGDGDSATKAKLKCSDVWVDASQNIFIADYVNQRIRKVSSGVVMATGRIDKELESKLYPNPTKGTFTIQLPVNMAQVTIYNISGMQVFGLTCTAPQTEIDITNQPPGVYMVYVQCGDKKYVSKIIKQ